MKNEKEVKDNAMDIEVTKGKKKKHIVGYEKEQKELKELSEMLINMDKYRELGLRIPRGLVLYGEPGVGKSVMAESIARKNIKVIELRAGWICADGAEACIRQCFEKAKNSAPAVIILDELDKIAGTSQAYFMQQNFDVNNILLQELDSLRDDQAVLVVATCNDMECLGSALLRPGRFDRQIHVMHPDQETRKKIFKYYFSKVALKCNLNYDYVARISYMKTPAEIECIVNESAIYAHLNGRDEVTVEDIRFVMNKMEFDGRPEKKICNKKEEHRVAVHEAGHALVAMTLFPDSLFGASIIPQGVSRGHVEVIQSESMDKSLEDMENGIAIALAGRIAEREILGKVYVGSASDLQRALDIAGDLLIKHGMSNYRFLMKSYYHFMDNCLSEQSKYDMECKVNDLLEKADKKAADIITCNKKAFDMIVDRLIASKMLSREELVAIMKECA